MYKWLLFLLAIILNNSLIPSLLSESSDWNPNFAYDLFINSITKFSPERIFIESDKDKIYQFDLEIMLPARERKFHLLMYEDVAFRESFLLSNGSDARFYEGIVKGNPSSSVLGFIHDGVFTGSIRISNKTYFVEPAHLVLDNIEDSQLSILYSNYDIVYPENICESVHSDVPSLDMDVKEFYKNAEAQKVLYGLTCSIEMVSDHTLYEFFNEDENKVLAWLYLHSKYLDYIFRNTDFDGDGKADNVRIEQTAAHIYKSKSDSNYPMAESLNMTYYFEAFQLRLQQYCLSISLLHRNFYNGSTIGLALTPQVKHRGGSVEVTEGGICDKNRHDSNKDVTYAKNVAIVNLRDKNGTAILGVTLLAVAHEVGHAFGSNHDPDMITDCLPAGKREYIMSEFNYVPEYPWMEKFSGCSIMDMNQILKHRSDCMHAMRPVCGNGIRDPGEECDCGAGQQVCQHMDPCCAPADVAPPEKGCTIRTSKGHVCSAKEEECCDDTCQVAFGRFCLYMVNECYPNVCDEKQTSCPKPRLRSNSKECESASQYCLGGFCENTICRKVGYLNCICNDIHTKECSVCCVVNGTCKPASVIGLRSLPGASIFFPEGTPCFSGLYKCTDDGKCGSSILKSGALYWFITFIILLLRRLLSVG